MVWVNPSGTIIQWRDQLVLCPSVIAIPMPESKFHYPNFAFTGEDADTIPAAMLAETPQTRDRYCEGGIPLVSGTLLAKFYFPTGAGGDAGAIETFIKNISYELGAQYYGFAWRKIAVTLASDANPAMRAKEEEVPNSEYRMVLITADYGLSKG